MVKKFSDYLDWLSRNQKLFLERKPGRIDPQHPGTLLAEKLESKYHLSQSELARRLGCTHAKVNQIVNGKRAITPEFALQLETILDEPAEVWISLQASFDLWQARQRRQASAHP